MPQLSENDGELERSIAVQCTGHDVLQPSCWLFVQWLLPANLQFSERASVPRDACMKWELVKLGPFRQRGNDLELEGGSAVKITFGTALGVLPASVVVPGLFFLHICLTENAETLQRKTLCSSSTMPSVSKTAAVAAAVAASAVDARTIFPKPTYQVTSPTNVTYPINTVDFAFSVASGSPTSDLLDNAFHRYYAIALGQSGAAAAFESTNWDYNNTTPIVGLEVTLESDDTSLTLETNVSYTLTVEAPTIKISAPNVYGAMNGLESFSQLVEPDGTIVHTTVNDNPRYQFRAVSTLACCAVREYARLFDRLFRAFLGGDSPTDHPVLCMLCQ